MSGVDKDAARTWFRKQITHMFEKQGDEKIQLNLAAYDIPSKAGSLCRIDYSVLSYLLTAGGDV